MKIFCCSDTHDTFLPKAPEGIDMYLHAGDIYDKLGTKAGGMRKSEMMKMLRQSSELYNSYEHLKIPFYVVNGNHDCEDPYQIFYKHGITSQVGRLSDNIILVGIGWSGNKFFELPTETLIRRECEKLDKLISVTAKEGDRIVVLTHYPPFFQDIYDKKPDQIEGWMFHSIARLCDKIKPVAIIQGHIHELFGNAVRRGTTAILCPGPTGMILDLSSEKPVITVL